MCVLCIRVSAFVYSRVSSETAFEINGSTKRQHNFHVDCREFAAPGGTKCVKCSAYLVKNLEECMPHLGKPGSRLPTQLNDVHFPQYQLKEKKNSLGEEERKKSLHLLTMRTRGRGRGYIDGVCRGMNKGREEDYYPLRQYLVEKNGVNLTFRTNDGETAADMALRLGNQRTYEYLTRKENEEIIRRAAAENAQAQLAEQVLAAEAAAQALVDELAAEEAAAEAAAEAKKQAKKAKKTKAKSKQARAAAGKAESGSKGGGVGDDRGGAAASAAAGLSVAALGAATGRLAIGENEEDEAQKKGEEDGQADDMLSAPAARMPELSSSWTCGDDDQEEEEDDEEAFETFLHQDVPLGLQCPIGICLLTDPINAADGQTYQRAELEKWIETCRIKQQPLTSPMTKESMIPMYFPNQYVKSHVAEFIEQRRREWVAAKGKGKRG